MGGGSVCGPFAHSSDCRHINPTATLIGMRRERRTKSFLQSYSGCKGRILAQTNLTKLSERQSAAATSGLKRAIKSKLVPKKGLEPPHPCEYMDLNHARLPIPPLRH